MAVIQWAAPGERTFRAGLSRGVIYPHQGPAAPWNGLIAVEERTGGSVTAHHYNGVKYAESVSEGDFGANIRAFTYPDEFEKCLGYADAGGGLQITQQERVRFDLSYVTGGGDDVNDFSEEETLHLVFNALASPSDNVHTTVGETLTPQNMVWSISTIPAHIPNRRPTAHLTVGLNDVTELGLIRLKEILYGTPISEPRFPTYTELEGILNSSGHDTLDGGFPEYTSPDVVDGNVNSDLVIDGGKLDDMWVVEAENLFPNPRPQPGRTQHWSQHETVSYSVENGATTTNTSTNPAAATGLITQPIHAGHFYAIRMRVRYNRPSLPSHQVIPTILAGALHATGYIHPGGRPQVSGDNNPVDIAMYWQAPDDAANFALFMQSVSSAPTSEFYELSLNNILLADLGTTEPDFPVLPFFDGDTPDADGARHIWLGAPYDSASQRDRFII